MTNPTNIKGLQEKACKTWIRTLTRLSKLVNNIEGLNIESCTIKDIVVKLKSNLTNKKVRLKEKSVPVSSSEISSIEKSPTQYLQDSTLLYLSPVNLSVSDSVLDSSLLRLGSIPESNSISEEKFLVNACLNLNRELTHDSIFSLNKLGSSDHALAWDYINTNVKEIKSFITEGVSFPFKDQSYKIMFQEKEQYPINELHTKSLSNQIQDWLSKGWVNYSNKHDLLRINPLLGTKKADGSIRWCLDPSWWQRTQVDSSFLYHRIDGHKEIIDSLSIMSPSKINDLRFIKIDLKDGYMHIPHSTRDTRYLGFKWQGNYLSFNRLIWGTSIAPGVFCKFMSIVTNQILKTIIKGNGFVSNHVDDFTIAIDKSLATDKTLADIISIFTSFNLKLNLDKSHLSWSESVDFVGRIYSAKGFIPNNKNLSNAYNSISALQSMIGQSKFIHIRLLLKHIGALQFCTRDHKLNYLVNDLYLLFKLDKFTFEQVKEINQSNKTKWETYFGNKNVWNFYSNAHYTNHFIHLNPKAPCLNLVSNSLLELKNNLKYASLIPFRYSQIPSQVNQVHCFTDASGKGFAYIIDNRIYADSFHENVQQINNSFLKEAIAINLALLHATKLNLNNIVLHTDCLSLIEVFNKKYNSKLKIVQKSMDLINDHKLSISFKYINTKLNPADYPSRSPSLFKY